jgi:hypothetical protein
MTELRKHELELLKAAANQPYEKGKAKWNRLIKVLHLPVKWVPGIQETLRQGKWRNQTSPIAYVRKAAARWAVQNGLVEIRRKPGKEVLASELNSKRSEDDALTEEHKVISELCQFEAQLKWEAIADRLSPEVVDEHQEVNWEKVAKLANLDAGERVVLDLKLLGLSWRDSIGACLIPEDRTILNTAWRRFDRHKNVMKQALLTGKHQHTRRIASVPDVELMFTEGDSGRLKIFFRRAASK